MFGAALAATFLIAGIAGGTAAVLPIPASHSMEVRRTATDLSVSELEHPAWRKADAVNVGTYWSGAAAPKGRHFTAKLLWSETALYVRFEAMQAEPLVVSERADRSKKQMGLWNRDVCEIFLAPDPKEPRRYFEFEVAPNGEWLDVALDLTSGKRISDWEYGSGMETHTVVGPDKVVMAIKIPWKAFGKTPKSGDVWLGNLLRCVGRDPGRGYLARWPTLTKEPAFHVPEKFGEFRFVGE